jgi:hypothetical protein
MPVDFFIGDLMKQGKGNKTIPLDVPYEFSSSLAPTDSIEF